MNIEHNHNRFSNKWTIFGEMLQGKLTNVHSGLPKHIHLLQPLQPLLLTVLPPQTSCAHLLNSETQSKPCCENSPPKLLLQNWQTDEHPNREQLPSHWPSHMRSDPCKHQHWAAWWEAAQSQGHMVLQETRVIPYPHLNHICHSEIPSWGSWCETSRPNANSHNVWTCRF